MYAKIINGTIRSAPRRVQYNGKQIFNPPEYIIQELGYLQVTYTDPPSDAPDGKHYESSWEQTDTEILQVWTLMDDPEIPEPEVTAQDLINAVERGLNS